MTYVTTSQQVSNLSILLSKVFITLLVIYGIGKIRTAIIHHYLQKIQHRQKQKTKQEEEEPQEDEGREIEQKENYIPQNEIDKAKEIQKRKNKNTMDPEILLCLPVNTTKKNETQPRQRQQGGEKKKQSSNKDDEEWRCVCETGFLPPGLLKNFGNMEAMVRMSTGRCYHKTT